VIGSSSVPKKFADFRCPICQSTEYDQATKSNDMIGPGSRTWLVHCICKGCSVIFQDAERFTTKGFPR